MTCCVVRRNLVLSHTLSAGQKQAAELCCTSLHLQESAQDMVWLAERRAEWLRVMGARVHDTVTFVDNHDLPRWLQPEFSSISRFK